MSSRNLSHMRGATRHPREEAAESFVNAQYEKALRESEARYRSLLQATAQVVWTTDASGQVVGDIPGWRSVTGQSAEEVKGLGWLDAVHPDDRERASAAWLQAVAARRGYVAEFRVRTAEGDYRHFASRGVPVLGDDGRVREWVGTCTDITERERARAELLASEAELRALFSVMTDVIVVLDREGRYLKVTPTDTSRLSRPAEEFLGKTLYDLFPPERAREFHGYITEALSKHRPVQVEYSLPIRGREVWFAGSVSPLAQDRVAWIVRDVTRRKRALQELQRSEERYRSLYDNANDIIYTHDMAGNFTSLNKAGEHITGYTCDEAARMNIAQVVAPEHLGRAREMIARKTTADRSTVYELEIVSKDGRRVPLEVNTRLLVEDGRAVGVQGVARDITERKRAEAAIQESEERYRDLVENATDIIYTHDLEGRYTSLNRAGEVITGYTRDELKGMTFRDIVAPDQLDRARLMLEEKLTGASQTSYEVEILAKDGRRVTVETNTRLIYQDGEPVGVQGIARDITARKETERQLLHNAFHDALTDLPNRAAFMERMEQAIGRMQRRPRQCFAVLFLDLDRFKVVNDSLGHSVGDRLLVEVGHRLRTSLRCPLDTVARLGGDEFTVLLEEIEDVHDAVRTVERIQLQLAERFHFDGHTVHTSASIGIVLATTEYRRPEDLLRDADSAMHRAKAMGKARYQVFDKTMHEQAVALLRTETELRRALERREIVAHYQPIVSLRTGVVVGFEALARWQHPERGLLAPDQFIAVAEETGLVIEIDRRVLETACRQVRRWQPRQPAGAAPLTVSVNLSARQFSHPSLIEQVRTALEESRLAPGTLHLEITESFLMSNVESVLGVFRQLKALDVDLHLDDFGTGYSSLGYLHRFRLDALKIDRAFVSHIGESGENLEIVRAIVTLAHTLGMLVVAEGVENASQLRELKQLGCEFGQGNYFSRPVDATSAAKLLDLSPQPEE